MNDRYLYRAKRIDNGEWVEGNLIHVNKDYYICEKPYECMDEYSSLNGQSYGFGGFKLVDQSTICQCTGLKDKNGKLIWENDICKYFNPEDKDGVAIIKEDYANWMNGTIQQTEVMTPLFYLKCSEEWNVIGNIFDNPELLEVEHG